MNLQEFRDSVLSGQPPAHLNFALSGLWWDAKGDWTRAHESAQQDEGRAGAWVHTLCFAKTRSCGFRTSASMTKFSVELKNQGIVAEIN